MKHPLLLSLALAGCAEPTLETDRREVAEAVTPVDAAAPADASGRDAPVLGSCGANRDPVLGVVCTYGYSVARGWMTLAGYQIVAGGPGWSDRVRCTWSIPCEGRLYPPGSSDGVPCLGVIGTGCPPPWPRAATVVLNHLLPDGMTDGQVQGFCDARPPSQEEAANACSALSFDTIHLFEDYCCVKRTIVNEFLDTFSGTP